MVVGQQLNVFVEPNDAAQLAAAITLLFRDEGVRDRRTKTRFAFLIQEWGIDRFRAALEDRWVRPLEAAGLDARTANTTDHLGVNAQKTPGFSSVGLSVSTGRIRSRLLAELASLAENYGSGEVRLPQPRTQSSSTCRTPRYRPFWRSRSLRTCLNPHSFERGLVTCTGTDYCNLALVETKDAGKRIADYLAERFPNRKPITMNWSECPAGCGNHQAADIGFQGARARVGGEIVDAVGIYVGGRTGVDPKPGQKVMELVPMSMLEELLPVVLNNFETLRTFSRDYEAEDRVVMVPAVLEA